jgi:hypothetical protein
MTLNCFWHCYFFRETLHWVSALKFFKLCRSVLIEELINRKITTTNSNVNFVFIDLNSYTFASKLINSFTFTHEHNFQLLTIWVVVDILCNSFINWIILHWYVYCNSWLEVNNIVSQSIDLFCMKGTCLLIFFQLFEKFKTIRTWSNKFILKISNRLWGWSETTLELLFTSLKPLSLFSWLIKLVF